MKILFVMMLLGVLGLASFGIANYAMDGGGGSSCCDNSGQDQSQVPSSCHSTSATDDQSQSASCHQSNSNCTGDDGNCTSSCDQPSCNGSCQDQNCNGDNEEGTNDNSGCSMGGGGCGGL